MALSSALGDTTAEPGNCVAAVTPACDDRAMRKAILVSAVFVLLAGAFAYIKVVHAGSPVGRWRYVCDVDGAGSYHVEDQSRA
jgi:hypothetical protein